MDFDLSPAGAAALDAQDPLAAYGRQFIHPHDGRGRKAIYFAGNSLGLQPMAARAALDKVLDEWAGLAVRGWSDGHPAWTRYDHPLAARTAPLLGAMPQEVTVCGALTTNLHALLASFYRPDGDRWKVLVEGRLFPSDRYALASQAAWHGRDGEGAVVEVFGREDRFAPQAADFADALEREGDSIALVLVGGINYLSGQRLPIGDIARLAHARGITMGVDLAHAVGNVPASLHDDGVDFAVWCGYKYLNGGPGAPAGLFVHERHHSDGTLPRLAGWWGHRLSDRFKMTDDFHPAGGAEGWQISTPGLLGLAPLSASLDLFAEAGFDMLRDKSIRLTGYLEALLAALEPARVRITTPADPESRGAQLSLRVAGNARAVFEGLAEDGVICDWREPDVIRVAPAPFYNTYQDVHRFVEILRQALNERG